MAYLYDIATAVPAHEVKTEALNLFFARVHQSDPSFLKKVRFLNSRTRIEKRYSCIPDFNGEHFELYAGNNFIQPVENRMRVYKEQLLPLACKAVDLLLQQSNTRPGAITHIITVSCTGLTAPGFELLLAEKYGLQHTEKTALNFLGCYAGLKALKYARYIAEAEPSACVLVVSAELCSLHFYPTGENEAIVTQLLFGDGAAAMLVCGNKFQPGKEQVVLKVNHTGSHYIPGTKELMTWDISSSAFRMHLDASVPDAIRGAVTGAVGNFSRGNAFHHWAIHPGGIRILEAIKEQLGLTGEQVQDSLEVLKQYGNMSSATILFVLQRTLAEIRREGREGEHVFSCAFGPGLNMEMVSLTAINVNNIKATDVQEQVISKGAAG